MLLNVSIDQGVRLCSHTISKDVWEKPRANAALPSVYLSQNGSSSNLCCGNKISKSVLFDEAPCVNPVTGFDGENRLM